MKTIFLLMTFIISFPTFANVNLELGDTVVALAAKGAKVSMFSKDISLPTGDEKLVIKFDSAVNPESVNQNRGRITSTPYIISFNYIGADKLVLSAQKVMDEKSAKEQAINPQFILTANGKPVPFTLKKIDQEAFNIFSDFKAFLKDENNRSEISSSDPVITPGNSDSLDKIKNDYNRLTDKQRLSFMKWLLNN